MKATLAVAAVAVCRGETICSWEGGVICNGSYTGSDLCATLLAARRSRTKHACV